MENKKICFVTINGTPNVLGGYVLYHKNLIKYLKKNEKNFEINWVYFGKENKKFKKEGVNYFELKTNILRSFMELGNHTSLSKFFKKNYFDIINCGGGPWTYFYKKKTNQKIIQTFHGTVYYFNKNHFKRFNFIEKVIFSPLLLLSWLQERPLKKVDKIICVSEKVKNQAMKLYSFQDKHIEVIRTGVDLKEFKPRDKKKSRKKLGLEKENFYGLYVGGGGYWTKGLDRAINLGREMYKLDKNFRLMIIGSDYKKVKFLLKEPFIVFLKDIPREKMPFYYSASDIFFNMSRYEGGAPTLVTSEAMASGCLLVCSKDSEQEIVKNNQNSLIIEKFNIEDAKRILEVYHNKKLREKMIKNSLKTIKELSLEKWGKKTAEALLK